LGIVVGNRRDDVLNGGHGNRLDNGLDNTLDRPDVDIANPYVSHVTIQSLSKTEAYSI
jgi:hypothetical protein